MTTIGVGVATQQIRGLQQTRDREVGQLAAFISDMGDVALTAKAMANDERGYLLTGDQKFAAEALDRVSVIDAGLQEARSHGGSARAASVDEISTALHAWVDVVSAEFTQFRADRDAAVETAMSRSRDLRKSYEKLLTESRVSAEKELVTGSGFAETVRKAVLSLWLLLLFSLLAAGVVAAMTVRSVSVELRRAGGVLAAAADGDLSQRLTPERTTSSADWQVL